MNGVSPATPRLSVCIPTRDRPRDLERCIRSILAQRVRPDEILVIDDGNLEVEPVRSLVEPHVPFRYFKKEKPSLSASKNLAVTAASHPLLLILDDDTVLLGDFIGNVLKRFAQDREGRLAAVGAIIENAKPKSRFETLFLKLFLIDTGGRGRILPWAFQCGFWNITGDTYVDWVPGGASCFRTAVLRRHRYQEFQGGRNNLEDIEHGWKISREYKMMISPACRLLHLESPLGREAMFETGYKLGYNRCWIFRSLARKNLRNRLALVWALMGQALGMLGTARPAMALGILSGALAFLKDGAGGKR